MLKSIEALKNEWEYVRGITLCFLEKLSDEDLHKKFPRKELNTILLQCNELYDIQQNYLEAIRTQSMEFVRRNLYIDSAEELIEKMRKLDEEMKNQLEILAGEECVSWFGEEKNIHEHLCAMIDHEMMHVGQIVAFCYAVGIAIPEQVVNVMSLDG